MEYLKITPSIYYQHIYQHDGSAFAPANCSVPCDTYTEQYLNLKPRLSNVADGQFVNPNLLQTPGNDQFYLPALAIDLSLANILLTSNTGYFDRSSHAPSDFTTGLASLLGQPWPQTAQYAALFDTTIHQEVFSQEFRVQQADPSKHLQWTLGIFYTRANQSTTLAIPAPGYGSSLGPLLPGGLVFVGIEPATIDRQAALFGQASYQVTRHLSLVAGARVARTSNESSVYAAGPLAGGVITQSGDQSQHVVDPKFGVNLQLDDRNLLYVSAAKGSRIGGANPPVITNDACNAAMAELGYPNGVPPTYKSDFLWSYEVGSKNRLFGDRLQLQFSVFHINWSDIQQGIYVQQCGGGFTSNLGKATSDGADLQANASLSDSLHVGLSASYTNAKNRTTLIPPGSDTQFVTNGDQINAYAAPWIVVPSIDYAFQVKNGAKGYVRLEDVFRSKNPGPFAALNPNNISYNTGFVVNPSTNELNVHVGVTWDRWDVSASAMNALNSHPVLYNGQYFPVGFTIPPASAYTIRPLTIGVQTVYRW
jgi:outer membrane receptor protein involved in Fe transport